ncbi:diacylglycerol kinase family protein [Anaerofustis sp.]|uniref:diacylglycerol kinase family protein n=1 Tax=Anaerofustis sp. TaxID=1872517 RepID=UPI0025C4E708|nr:diacylglycerol kinase family protein [Anaerofustis sp.]
MIGHLKRLFKSFKYAFHGVEYNFKTQQNFKIHCTCAVIAVIGALLLHFSYYEWLVLAFTIFLVIILEAVNTAIEEAVNCATKEMNENAKRAKDSAACAVLIGAFMSLVIGAVLYIPKIINLIWG